MPCEPRKRNWRQRLPSSLTEPSAGKIVIIAYGLNAARYVENTLDFDVLSDIIDYREIIARLKADGYLRGQIVIATPYYISDAGLKKGSKRLIGQTREGNEAYVVATKQLANESGAYLADTWIGLPGSFLELCSSRFQNIFMTAASRRGPVVRDILHHQKRMKSLNACIAVIVRNKVLHLKCQQNTLQVPERKRGQSLSLS